MNDNLKENPTASTETERKTPTVPDDFTSRRLAALAEEVEKNRKPVEKTEKNPRTNREKEFHFESPKDLATAFDAVANAESSLTENAKALSRHFEETQKTIEAANQEVEQINDHGFFGGAIAWAKDTFTKYDSPLRKAAIQARENAKKQFEEGLREIAEKSRFIETEKEKLGTGAKNLIETTEQRLKKTVEGRDQSLASIEIAKNELAAALPAFNELKLKGETLEKDFQSRIDAVTKKLEEIETQLQALAKEKEEKEAEKEDLNAQLETAKEEEKKGLVDNLKKITKRIAAIEKDEETLTSRKTVLEEDQTKLTDEFEEKKSEHSHAFDEATEKKKLAESNVQQAEKASETLKKNAEEVAQSLSASKSLEQEITIKLAEFAETNGQMRQTLSEQAEYLKTTEVKELTFFNSFVKSIPLIGKYGIIGGLETINSFASKIGIFQPIDFVIDDFSEWSKDVPAINVVSGALAGTKDLIAGIWNAVTLPADTLDGVVNLAAHPSKLKEIGRALIQYDEFEKGNIGYAIGRMIPDIGLLITTSGAGAAVRGTGTFGKIIEVAKAGALSTPKAIIKAPWLVTKATFKIARSPFTFSARFGRSIKGMAKGLTPEETAMYAQYGTKRLEKFYKNGRGALDATRDAANRAVSKLATSDPDFAIKFQALDDLYTRIEVTEVLKISVAKNALAKLHVAPIPAGATKIPFWKRPIFAKKPKTAMPPRKPYKEILAEHEAYVAGRKIEREILLRQMEKGVGDLTLARQELAILNKEIFYARLKFAKELAEHTPGVRGAWARSLRMREFIMRSLENAKLFTETSWMMLKNFPMAMQFAKYHFEVIAKTFYEMAKTWNIYPVRMFNILTNPSFTYVEKFALLIQNYPALRIFIEARGKEQKPITVTELESALRKIAENDLAEEAEV